MVPLRHRSKKKTIRCGTLEPSLYDIHHHHQHHHHHHYHQQRHDDSDVDVPDDEYDNADCDVEETTLTCR